MLILCAVGDGNLALNTNPMPDGRIEPRQVTSFRKIGKWMKKYGESIYGTRGGPFIPPDRDARRFNSARDGFKLPTGRWWGGATHKGKTVYLHILRWPGDSITLPPIGRKIISHAVLTGGKATVEQTDSAITVSVAPKDRDDLDTIVKLQLDGPAAGVKPGRLPSSSLAFGKKASASGVWPNPRLDAALAFDDDMTTRWGGAQDSKSGWLAVDLGAEKTFGSVFISEAYDRVRKFELQVKSGDSWRTFFKGTKIGEKFLATFAPVTARHVRLNIIEANHVPTICEVRLFPPKAVKKKGE